MQVREEKISAQEFRQLFESVGWEAPGEEQIAAALNGSRALFCAREGERPLGMARLIGDGGMSWYVKDLAILPEFQGRGIGRALMQAIEEWILACTPHGWAVSLELISSKGREGFYEKLGFEARPNAWDGAGMLKMLRK